MILFLTPGDPEGIGPEITLKALRSPEARKWRARGARIVCVGARAPFEKLGAKLEEWDPSARAPSGAIPFVSAPASARRGLHLPGYQSGWSIEKATSFVRRDPLSSAIVTGPISKERLQKGGFPFPGHTEMLASLCKTRGEVTMMLANDQLRISLATTHCSIRELPKELTRARVRRAVLHTAESLSQWWGIKKPRIAILGLNPHAGESGLFGNEERHVIEPEIRALQGRLGARCELSGPHPADTLFAMHILAKPEKRYDAVVCMYHDQGLIPVKLLDFQRTVNVTLGLPIVRTSVDHGTGFDIAGKGIADPSSLMSAIDLAVQILRKRGTR